ncbi:MAG TPA: tetratricopeptide repeat protein [Chryseolinea sp.]|nr:tetratricopeptide repeat protein [Chryseolinea sp.]
MRAILIITLAFAALICRAQDKKIDVGRLYEKGEEAFNDARYQEALSIFNKCLQENPKFAEAYFSRAATREQLKDLQGAHTDYNIYLELKPNQPEALYSVAILQYQLGKYEESKENLLKLLTVPPGETTKVYFRISASTTGKNQITTAQSGIKHQVFNYLGMSETKLKNYKAAIVWLDSAIQIEGKEADYYVNRALAKEGIQDTTAMADYKKALQLNPDHTAALHNIAVANRTSGDSTSSMDNLEKAIESDSSMLYPYLARAYQRMEAGYFKGALEDYNKALEINDKDAEIWMNRAIVKEKLNDLKGAFSDYTQAIELNEKFEKAWLNRGNVLSKQGKFKEAIEDYTVAITFNPEYGYAYYNRAIAKQKLKLGTEACDDLKIAEQFGQTVSEKVKKEICK